MRLLRHEHGAHAPLAESLEQLVPAGDDRPDILNGAVVRRGFGLAETGGTFLTRRHGGSLGRADLLTGRRLEKAPDLRMGGEKAFDPSPQVVVIATSGVEISRALFGRALFQGGEEDGLGGGLFGSSPRLRKRID